MYLNIGPNKAVRKRDVVAIFDLDSSTVSLYTRKFLMEGEREGRVELLSYDLPKSFILMRDDKIYLSPFNSSTIYR